MKGPTLSVGAQTGAAQIHELLNGLNKDGKLRAKQDSQGNTILYASTKRSNLLSRMTGRAAEKRNAARELINNALAGVESGAHTGAVHEGMRAPTSSAFRDIRNFLRNSSKSALRVKAATFGLETGEAVAETARTRNQDKSGVPLGKLGDLQADYALAAGHLLNGDDHAAMETLGDAIGRAASGRFTASEKEAFAFSAGVGLRQKISAGLEQALGDAFDKRLPPGPERDSFLRQTAFQAASHVLTDRQIDANTIRLGGNTFTKVTSEKHPDGKIGTGGYADVYLYQRRKDDGSVEKVAVKFPHHAPDAGEIDRQLDEFGHELLVHKAALSGGSENIVGVKGALRTTDGGVAIALEYAPNGDLAKAIEKLADAVKDHRIPPQAAAAVRLTLLQDMAKGVAAMEKQGIINGDAKPPNVLIGEGGVAKIADLGTAQIAESYRPANSAPIDNPQWLAPEVLAAQRNIREIDNFKTSKLAELKGAASAKILDAVGLAATELLSRPQKKMIDHLLGARLESDKQEVTAGAKGDAWALGVTGFNLLYGRLSPVDKKFYSDIEEDVVTFAGNAANRAISAKGGFATASGFVAEDDLINKLMHPDPNQRWTAQQALDHRAFKAPGVGSQQARDLIVALMRDDADGMAAAAAHFDPPAKSPNQDRPLPPTPGAVG